MNGVAVAFIILLVGFIGVAARANDVTLESVPPVVGKTVPEADAGGVGQPPAFLWFKRQVADRPAP